MLVFHKGIRKYLEMLWGCSHVGQLIYRKKGGQTIAARPEILPVF